MAEPRLDLNRALKSTSERIHSGSRSLLLRLHNRGTLMAGVFSSLLAVQSLLHPDGNAHATENAGHTRIVPPVPDRVADGENPRQKINWDVKAGSQNPEDYLKGDEMADTTFRTMEELGGVFADSRKWILEHNKDGVNFVKEFEEGDKFISLFYMHVVGTEKIKGNPILSDTFKDGAETVNDIGLFHNIEMVTYKGKRIIAIKHVLAFNVADNENDKLANALRTVEAREAIEIKDQGIKLALDMQPNLSPEMLNSGLLDIDMKKHITAEAKVVSLGGLDEKERSEGIAQFNTTERTLTELDQYRYNKNSGRLEGILNSIRHRHSRRAA